MTKFSKNKKIVCSAVSVLIAVLAMVYIFINSVPNDLSELTILNGEELTLEVGTSVQIRTSADEINNAKLRFAATGTAVLVDKNGCVTALAVGKTTMTVSCGNFSDAIRIIVIENDPDTMDDVERAAFYEDYSPADSYTDACERSRLGLLSGELAVPDQAPMLSVYRPQKSGVYIRNEETRYLDENTYVVVDAYGEEVFRIYRGGGYITLEEVAAYVYAFGDVPANYVKGKNMEPENSIWGEYLRLNHTEFSGNTEKYPYEPVLPDISGCGGELSYYEIDIGTTGTDCDPRYTVKIYNDGKTITRGAARIVYTRYDKNGDAIIDPNEKFVFYTYNHYNDFQEYLNYYGGWGAMFGNITGGGEISSNENYNPTPYVPTVFDHLSEKLPQAAYLPYVDTKRWLFMWGERLAA